MKLDYSGYNIPPHTQDSLNRYIEQGIWPGSFCECILTNDLTGAVARADLSNTIALTEIVHFMIDRMPQNSWGSAEAVATWIHGHYEVEGV